MVINVSAIEWVVAFGGTQEIGQVENRIQF